VPQNLYRCAGDDAWIAVAVLTDAQWMALRETMGDPEWARAADLEHAAERRGHLDLLDDRLSAWFADKDPVEVAERLCTCGVPAAPVVAPSDVTENIQLRARGFFEQLVHPVTGANLYAGLPVRFERGPGRWNRTPPPTLGQHNEEILLGELEMDPEEWKSYRASGIIGEIPRL
jgi:crotonobetainyl-CoA:carnitine CoA-transferase CaiB-like acyl-CoA transferase